MIVYCNSDFIYYVEFKRIKFLIDNNIYVFLGNLKNNCIEYNDVNINFKLLNKFKLNFWDENSNKMVSHIKFLVKYSSILSKLINEEEFNDVEFKEFDARLIFGSTFEYGSYYIRFNNKNFLNMQSLKLKSDTILINVEKELMDLLNKEGDLIDSTNL